MRRPALVAILALAACANPPASAPGEFGNIVWIDRCGTDSLFFWDATRRMMIVTDSAGGFAREFRPEGNPWELSCSSSGWIGVLGLPHEYVPPGADGTRTTASVWAVDLEGRVVAEFPDVPLGENRPLGLPLKRPAGEGP